MTTRNSTKKGDVLEKKVFELVSKLLSDGDFFVNGKHSKIFLKKAYYSEKRGSDIILDITIETYLPGADKYSLLTIIECKNLDRKVAVDDVEEFNSKISQIGEHNTKGVIISASYLQEGALNYAKSQKIAVAKIQSNDSFEWINYRVNKSIPLDIEQEERKIFDETSSCGGFLSIHDNVINANIADLLLQLGVIDFYNHSEKFIKIPFRTEDEYDKIVKRFQQKNVYNGWGLDIDKVCKLLTDSYPMKFDFESEFQGSILGKIEFDPLLISIASSLKSEVNRWRFTIAHEIGHLVLHYKLLKGSLAEKTDNEFSLTLKHYVSDHESRRLEYQANAFASRLLLPTDTFSDYMQNLFTQDRIHRRKLFLDSQRVNQQLVFMILNKVGNDFGVSNDVARIRLVKMGLLEGKTDYSIKGIIKGMDLGNMFRI